MEEGKAVGDTERRVARGLSSEDDGQDCEPLRDSKARRGRSTSSETSTGAWTRPGHCSRGSPRRLVSSSSMPLDSTSPRHIGGRDDHSCPRGVEHHRLVVPAHCCGASCADPGERMVAAASVAHQLDTATENSRSRVASCLSAPSGCSTAPKHPWMSPNTRSLPSAGFGGT